MAFNARTTSSNNIGSNKTKKINSRTSIGYRRHRCAQRNYIQWVTLKLLEYQSVSDLKFNILILWLYYYLKIVESFCPRLNKWSIVKSFNGRRLQFGVALMEDKLIVCGGRDGLKTLNSASVYLFLPVHLLFRVWCLTLFNPHRLIVWIWIH